MAELSIEEKATLATMQLEEVLDHLVEGYTGFSSRDRASGVTDDDGALGGLLMVIEAGVQPAMVKPLLALAIRRLACREVPDASS